MANDNIWVDTRLMILLNDLLSSQIVKFPLDNAGKRGVRGLESSQRAY